VARGEVISARARAAARRPRTAGRSALRRFLRDNGLSLAFLGLFAVSWAFMSLSGLFVENQERADHGEAAIGYLEYVTSAHFWQGTLENFQSEFLQMATFVWFTTFLLQRGSPESRKTDGSDPTEKDPRRNRTPASPWPVHRGGLALMIYERSLTLALLVLFVISWFGHAWSGATLYNQEQAMHGGEQISVLQFVATSQFWYETLQNWQSEWIAIFTLVVLAIFLRQRGASESKPVFEPNTKTGH
jgi:hypothetical protein